MQQCNRFVVSLSTLLLVACTEPAPLELLPASRAEVVSVAEQEVAGRAYVSIEVRLSNPRQHSVYVAQCFDVERRSGKAWVIDAQLSAKCISVAPIEIPAERSALQSVIMLRNDLHSAGDPSPSIRVVFSYRDQSKFGISEQARTAEISR